MMKTFTLILILASGVAVRAQNFAVTLWSAAPTNTEEVVAGIPTSAPMMVCGIGTNAVVTPPALLMTSNALENCMQTNQVALAAYTSNVNAQVVANLGALRTAYSNLNFVAQNWGSITNLPTAKFAIQAEGEVLLKLKTILQQAYQGQ